MAVQEKSRINISLADKEDCDNLLKLKHRLETKQDKHLSLVEVVRIAIQQAITNN